MNGTTMSSVLHNLIKLVLVAALYYLIARLGLLTMLSSINIPALWAASGLAQAAVLIWGWPAGLGIFAGALLVFLGITGTPAVAIAMACGSVGQAALAAWLLNRYVRPLPPETVRNTLLTLGISALSALLAPLFGVIGRCYFGMLPWNEFVSQVWLLWLSGMVGILIFTPGLIHLAMSWRRKPEKETLIWAMTSFVLGVTLFSVLVFANFERQRERELLQWDTTEIANLIQSRLDRELQTLTAIDAHYSTSTLVSRDDFQVFTSTLLSKSPATDVLEWLPRVTQAERPAYEQGLREQGFVDFTIFEKDPGGNRITAGNRTEYFPVDFIQSFESNKAAFGYDLGSHPERLVAIQRARDSGLPVVTSSFGFLPDSSDQKSVLILVPIYRNGMPISTIAERRANLSGFVGGIYRVNALVAAALKDLHRRDLELYLYDVDDSSQKAQFLSFTPSFSGPQTLAEGGAPSLEAIQAGVFQTKTIQIADRNWLLVVRPGAADVAYSDEWISLMILLVGLGLAGGFLFYVMTRQKTEKVLARSETEFRTLSDYALTGVLRMRLSGEILYANQALAQMVGIDSPNELLHANAQDFVNDLEQFAALPEMFQAAAQIRNQKIEIRSRQGEIHHVLYSASLNGDVVSATVIDITEREQAQEKLTTSEQRYRQLVDGMPGVVYSFSDRRGGIFYSPGVEAIFGFSPEYMIANSLTWHDAIHPEDLAAVDQAVGDFARGGNLNIEYRVRNRRGEIRWLSDRSIGREVREDEIIIHGLAMDITESKQIEEALRQKDAEYRLISEHTGDMMLMIDLKSRTFTYISPVAEKMLGFTPQELLGREMSELMTADSYQKLLADLPGRIASFSKGTAPASFTDEIDQFRKDGSTVTTEVVTSYVKKENGEIQVVGVSRDISERKQAAQLQETVYRIAEDAQNSESLQELYPQIHQRISDVMYAQNFYIALYTDVNDMLSFVYSADENGSYDPTPFRAGQGLTEYVLRTQQSLLCDDLKAEELRLQGAYTPRGNSSSTWLGVPLIVHGKAIGVMAVQNYHDSQAYTSREQRILEFVSSQVAVAIDRKQAEDNLVKSQASLEMAQQVAQMGSWDLDIETGRGFWSKEMYQLMRRDPSAGPPELPEFLEMVFPEDRKVLMATQQLAIDLGESVTTIYRAEPIRGMLRYFETRIQPVIDAQRKLITMSGTVMDVTERRKMEIEIHERVKELTCLFTVSRLLDENSNSDEFVCQQIVDTLVPAMQFPSLAAAMIDLDGKRYSTDRYDESLSLCQSSDIVVAGETRGRLSGFYTRDDVLLIQEERDLISNLARMFGLWLERRQSERALSASNERFSQLAENIQEVFWMYDRSKKKIIYVSPAYEAIWGRSITGIYKNPDEYVENILPEDQALMLAANEKQTQGESTDIEYRVRRPDGSLRWVWDRGFPIFDKNGDLVRTAGVATDITDLKIAQQALQDLNSSLEKRVEERTAEVRQSEATYRALFENSNDGIFIMSPEGIELRANQRALDLVAYSQEEWHDISNDQLVVDEEREDAWQRFQAVAHGELMPLYERVFLRKDGKKVNVEINLSAVRDADGKVIIVQSVVRDITERKKIEASLRESEERYRRAISAADAVPYSLDYGSDHYTFMGEGIERLTGYTRDEMTPRLFNAFILESQYHGEMEGQSTPDVIRKVRSGELTPSGILRSDFRILAKNGEHRWLLDASVQIMGASGHATGSIGILQDVTYRKTAEEILRENRDKLSAANAALEKASRLKDEFLASMSHELRTPLTGILGLSEALQLQTHGSLNERQLKALRNIEKSGRHLLELINDILDLSKIEAGKLDLQLEPFSVVEVCQASLQLVKGMAHQKNHNIDFAINISPIMLRADARRMKQMLVNLLSNAIKFTPEGGQIGLEVEARPEENTIRFSVWDKGIGIRSEELGKLFQPFVQLDSSLERQYAGTGLGLSLVQRMAELHGGSVQLESAYGEGSRFTITLPWFQDEPDQLPDSHENDPFQIKTTLTIEDNDLAAEQITRYLNEMGIANVIQPVIHGALENVVALNPSAILLDLNLPDGSGMDLLARLKADARTHSIPVIITSVEDRHAEAYKLGAANYLVKPFNQEELRTQLAKIATLRSDRPVMVLGKTGIAPLILVADDNELILETIGEFLIASGFRVITARSGFELLERVPELHPDIILVDIQMPGMDGFKTIRRLRTHNDARIASTPLIAITALAMSGDREHCLEAGANEYLSKPIVLKQLVKKIVQLLTDNPKA